jgi:hypothetical protein
MTDAERFRDPHATIYDFADEQLVACPQCGACARVLPVDAARAGMFDLRRLTCARCGHLREWRAGPVGFGAARDSYFGLPLWLQTPVDEHTLWAYNLRHLDLIEGYVRAKHRERRASPETGHHNKSLISRLPQWLKLAKNRERVLRGIERLRQKSV